MTFRTILAPVSGGSASGGALDLACRLAVRFRAHLEAFHVILDPRAAFAATGEGFGLAPAAGLVAAVMDEATAKATATRVLFDRIVARHDITPDRAPQPGAPGPTAMWREATGYAPQLVSRRARFFDLVVLGRSDRVINEPYTDTIEETLLRSGRPILLAPAEVPPEVSGAVAIAWNGSPEAVHALAASLPFLAEAKAVWVITSPNADDGALFALEYLAWHNVAAEHRILAERPGRHAGRALIETAADCGADLLVMGGYGHAAWRQQMFGGATREAVGAMTLPLLIAH